MTGYDILKQTCALLGYESQIYNSDDSKKIAFWHILNQILTDLELPETKGLSDILTLSQKQKEALIYGCAMLFSASVSDIALSNTFTALYNGKRNGVLCKKDIREDTIPFPVNGGN